MTICLNKQIIDQYNMTIDEVLLMIVLENNVNLDEAQKVLNKDYLPQVDICRESKFEYIFATQDEILLQNKLGQNKFEELYTNIASKYSFATNSNEIKNKFEYIDLNTNKKAIAIPMFFDNEDLIKVEHEFQKV